MLQENDIQKSVLEKIHSGQAPMRSRAFFVLRTLLVVLIAVLVIACSLFALSFVFFSVHESHQHFLLAFGNQGLLTFVMLFPWTSVFLFLILVVGLEFLARRYTSVYKFSLLRIFLWILVVGIVGSTIIGFTPLHSYLLSAADRNGLPVIGPWYEHVRDSHWDQGVYRGYVTVITDPTFVISHNDTDRDSDEGSWIVTPPPGYDLTMLSVGEKVYVAGHLQDGVIHAYGIRPLPREVK